MGPLAIAQEKSALSGIVSRVLGTTINPSQLTSSVLRSDTALSTVQSYNNISFNASKASPNGSEKLLQINDSFIATGIRLSAKKLTATPTDVLHGQAREFTYPNTFVFDGTNEVAGIFALWNGFLTFKQNTDVAFPSLWTGDMHFAPDSMFGDHLGIAVGPLNARRIADSKNSPNYGFAAVEPIVLKGTDQLRADLNLAGAANITESAEFNFFTITLKGYLISGVNRVN